MVIGADPYALATTAALRRPTRVTAHAVTRLHEAVVEAEEFLIEARPLPDPQAEQLRQEAAALCCELLIALSRLRARVR